MAAIPDQTKLPFKVALDVVLQGIRIRFGRSVVTISGVILGVAFLMSILSGIVLKEGVAEEDELRLEIQRMQNFLEAETGLVADRSFAVIPVGPLSTPEARFLERLKRSQASEIRLHDPRGLLTPAQADRLRTLPPDRLMEQASGLILMGSAAADDLDLDITTVMTGARQPVIALSNPRATPPAPAPGVSVIRLSRELRPEEIRAREEQARKDRFRDLWIIAISILVTVIGISNAMLMSVTERFREIGTMKCLGALSAFVRRMFIIESAIMGIVGGLLGSLGGFLFTLVAYLVTYSPGLVFTGLGQGLGLLAFAGAAAVVIGLVLSIIAAIYPANVAARMLPAVALRSNV
ncbi:MAG: FtsX-like permease family protein [Puniceicoccaceae bacterium]|nr:MAG: FtsX-like permease family protein [Puniceicoccaceae bacterium]